MRTPTLVRIVQVRPRLFLSLAIGVLVSAALAVLTDWRLATRLLVAWDISVALYLALATHLMSRSDVDRIRDRAAMEDEGQFAILVLTVVAALASLGAIFAELGTGTGRRPAHIVLAALTILLSWAFIHTIFALHYAHEFYDETIGGGMAFPGREAPASRPSGEKGWTSRRPRRRRSGRGDRTDRAGRGRRSSTHRPRCRIPCRSPPWGTRRAGGCGPPRSRCGGWRRSARARSHARPSSRAR